MKSFNTAGTCRPDEHYMVDITERLAIIRKMVAKGDYFCINRGRQYGKTTTLEAISSTLSDEYCIFSISFEAMPDSYLADEELLYAGFVDLMARSFLWTPLDGLDAEVGEYITTFSQTHADRCGEKELSLFVSTVCHRNSKPVVLLIDEVDQAGNYPSFLKLLALLRRMYLGRKTSPTFQSVILAGVYDVKNLKLKLRPEDQHQYNSPWNIAVPFAVDMSLSADGIAGMLAEYKADHQLTFDEKVVAQLIRDYTAGYPFLVSRICQIIADEGLSWDKEGVQKAVNEILMERNTLFDNMIKKLDDYPDLKAMLKRILFNGVRETYNPDEKSIQIATMFNYIVNQEGQVAVACRIMETRLYNYLLAEQRASKAYLEGQAIREDFIHDGIIDMPHLLEKFCTHVNETFDMDRDHAFLEENGRQIFLTYLRPVINGIGNYYIEARTRNNDRMDVVVDYLGIRYVIELKIWRGNAYNERGENQLSRYLEDFDLQTGYLLSFCFNKKKQPGLQPPLVLKGRTLIEAIV